MFLPGLGALVMQRRQRGGDGLVALRALFVAFVTPMVWFGVVVLLVVEEDDEPVPVWPVVGGLVLMGVLAAVASSRVLPLRCGALVSSYRTRLFVRLAMAEATALAGVVATFVTGHGWLYLVGLAASAPVYRRAAPSRPNLVHDQAQLQESACGRDLTAALRTGMN